MEQGKNKKITIYFLIFIAVLVLVLALLFGSGLISRISRWSQSNSVNNPTSQSEEFNESTFLTEGMENPSSVPNNVDGKNLLKSENYKIKQITFGGSAVAATDNAQELAVDIANLQSEALLSQDNKEAKLLISWETNKEALSTVEYSRSDGQNAKSLSEGRYNSSHRLVLSGLDPGAIYIYQIKSRDRWGNEFTSEYYSVYSGSPAVSVFDLISKSMNEMFGWAIKR